MDSSMYSETGVLNKFSNGADARVEIWRTWASNAFRFFVCMAGAAQPYRALHATNLAAATCRSSRQLLSSHVDCLHLAYSTSVQASCFTRGLRKRAEIVLTTMLASSM